MTYFVTLLVIMMFAASGCSDNVNNGAGQIDGKTSAGDTNNQANLSIFRGNLQRNGVFANGGTPALKEQLWSKTQVDSLDFAPIVAGDMLMFAPSALGFYGVDLKTGSDKWGKLGKSHRFGEPTYNGGILYYWWEDGLHALDTKTKQEKWVFKATSSYLYHSASPAVTESAIYLGAEKKLQSIDRNGGQVIWASQFADFVTSDVAVDNDIAYFTAGYDRTPPGGDNIMTQVNLYAADARTGQELWKFEPQGNENMPGSVEAPIVGGGVVYCASGYNAWIGPGRVYAFDGKTGQQLWNHPVKDLNDPELLAFANGLLFVATDASSYYGNDATLRALDGKTGEEKWSFVQGDYMSAPAVSGKRVYISAGKSNDQKGDTLYALDFTTGKVLGQIQLVGAVTHPIVIEQGTIFYASQDLDVLGWWVSAVR